MSHGQMHPIFAQICRDNGLMDVETELRIRDAAPQMYDALCRIHSWLVCAPICTPDDMMKAVAEMEQRASAAIARAEGRQ